jgi:pimeloyl-ACP methyl ester carboxylesterase
VILGAVDSDPSLLKKHSVLESVHVESTRYTYSQVRVFHSPHPQESKLPALPLLVFIHGLGGSVAQFHPLLTSLSNFAPCLAIDLPGCGVSKLAPRYWHAYTTDSLARLLIEVINRFRDEDQEIVFICHSMGCSLGALLSSTTSSLYPGLGESVSALIAICPPNKALEPAQVNQLRWLLCIPDPIFDLWRAWDRRGGTESGSVTRFVGKNAEQSLKRLQVRFNTQSKTPVFRRMAYGALPKYRNASVVSPGAFVGEKIWSGVKVPVLLIAGKDDPVTAPSEASQIAQYLGHSGDPENHHKELMSASNSLSSPSFSPILSATTFPKSKTKFIVFPSPASHALMYSPLLVRPVSNLLQHFLASSVTPRLSLGWQLQHLTTEGKWDVKNLRKWAAVEPVSAPIAGVFRAMKTLREVDGEHTPKAFVSRWAICDGKGTTGPDGLGAIAAVVDISHDPPVYDPQGLERGGIAYRKCPSVSKLPPTFDEVRIFIDVIDNLRAEIAKDYGSTTATPAAELSGSKLPFIAVHCHYGFNRTGFFVVAYMVERMGWPLRDAIDEFAQGRPPGIRHMHFIDELWGRYWDWEDTRAPAI